LVFRKIKARCIVYSPPSHNRNCFWLPNTLFGSMVSFLFSVESMLAQKLRGRGPQSAANSALLYGSSTHTHTPLLII
jgi:hypothetical protein